MAGCKWPNKVEWSVQEEKIIATTEGKTKPDLIYVKGDQATGRYPDSERLQTIKWQP